MIEITLTLSFILIAILGLFLSIRASFLMTLLSMVVFSIIILQKKYYIMSTTWEINAFVILFLYIILFYLLIAKIKQYYDYHLIELDKTIQKTISRIELLSKTNKKIKQKNQVLKEKAHELSIIYNSIKNMSTHLDFDETLKAFATDLYLIPNFIKGRLILINTESEEKSSFKIENIYKFFKQNPAEEIPNIENTQPDSFDFTAVDYFLSNRKSDFIYFENIENSIFSTEEYQPQYPISLIPLEIKQELLGILITEGIKINDIQKAQIMANHFSMEIKKIKLYEKLKSLSIIDGLTTLYLRRHFTNRLEEEIKRAKKNKGILSLMMIDIDNFKTINDKYGHLAGDIVLRETANIIKSNSREIDLIGRYGGDEIIMTLPMTPPEKAREIAERIRRMIEKHRYNINYASIYTTVSIGIAYFPKKNIKTITDLINTADKALYEAKNKGKNKIVIAI